RAKAFKDAIAYQAQTAPGSFAGVMAFAGNYPGGVARSVRPLQLNNANNVTTLSNSIVIDNAGGTPYSSPLDSAKNWLRNLVTDSTKAIIFLTDGRPDNGDPYLNV